MKGKKASTNARGPFVKKRARSQPRAKMRSAFRAKALFSRSNPPSNPRDNPRVRVFRGKKHLQNRSSGTSSSSHKIDPSHRNRTHHPRKKHAPLLQDPNMVRVEDEDVEHKKLISFIFLARFYSNRSRLTSKSPRVSMGIFYLPL